MALSVSCAASALEVLPITLNPGIQRLQLQHNNIRAVDAALGFYAQLQYVDISHNQLIRSDQLFYTIKTQLQAPEAGISNMLRPSDLNWNLDWASLVVVIFITSEAR